MTFNIKESLYEWKVMPFGLYNSLSTFMRLMNEALKLLLGNICIIYFDDILVFSSTFSNHLAHLKPMFLKLQQNELCLNLDKCEFAMPEVHFLNFIIGNNGVKTNPKKLKQY